MISCAIIIFSPKSPWCVGEVLPDKNNSVTLSNEKDEYGMPRPVVTFSYRENDNKLIAHAVQKANEILMAAGGGSPRL